MRVGGFGQLWSIILSDTHPPFHYLLLKPFTDLVALFTPSVWAETVAGKYVSLVPMVLLWFVAKRRLGTNGAWLLALVMIACRQYMEYALEVRMYSWAIFFVGAAHVCAVNIMDGRKSWQALALYSLGAAYTHNYALISVFFLWLCLLVWSVRHGSLRQCIAGGACVALGFAPWLIVLLRQTGQVAESGFWIEPVTFLRLTSDAHTLFPNLMLPVLGLCCAATKRCLSQRIGIAVVALTLSVSLALSFALLPIYLLRYILPACVCLCILMAQSIERLRGRWRLGVELVVCLMAWLSIWSTAKQEVRGYHDARKVMAFAEQMEPGSAVVSLNSDQESDLFPWELSLRTKERVYTQRFDPFWPRLHTELNPSLTDVQVLDSLAPMPEATVLYVATEDSLPYGTCLGKYSTSFLTPDRLIYRVDKH